MKYIQTTGQYVVNGVILTDPIVQVYGFSLCQAGTLTVTKYSELRGPIAYLDENFQIIDQDSYFEESPTIDIDIDMDKMISYLAVKFNGTIIEN